MTPTSYTTAASRCSRHISFPKRCATSLAPWLYLTLTSGSSWRAVPSAFSLAARLHRPRGICSHSERSPASYRRGVMAMALEAKAVRALSRDVPTCVAVVAVKEGQDTHHHMTVGSLCVVSQIPPLLSFCVARGTAAHSRMCEAPRYCISVLAQDQELVAKRFAAPRDGRTSVEPGTFHGFFAAPHSLAWLLCTRDRLIDAGGSHDRPRRSR